MFNIIKQKNLKGILWVIAWALSYTMAVSVIKFIGHSVPTAMKIFMRLFFGLCLFSPFLLKSGIKQLATRRFPLYMTRTFFVLCSMFCTYYAYAHLPLAFATSIGFTGPLMTTLLAIIFLRERVRMNRWIALAAGYVGVLVMVRPGIVEVDPAVGLALLANLFASSTLIITKELTKTDSTNQIMLHSNILSILFTAIAAAFQWQMPTSYQIMFLVLLGGLGAFSQFCMIKAYKYSDPSFLAPFEYLRLVFAIPLGIYVFDECPDMWALIGSMVIIATTFYMSFAERKEKTSNSM